ncbi:MAG TPA: metal-sensitive transcriptional regulator [Neobacillus sp.]|jgi:DNA-binding FrmR family transcriptional regulator
MKKHDPIKITPHCNEHCDALTSERKSHHSDKTKQNLVTRLNRVEGQIRGIKGLIEKDTYCDDVITQIAATQAALNSVAKILLEGHMRSCVVERIQEGDTEVVDELLTTIQRLMKK